MIGRSRSEPSGSPVEIPRPRSSRGAGGGAEGDSGARYPGIPAATDGTGAVVHAETLASEAAGAYPITPSTQMGEGWAEAVAAGKTNVHGRRLLFFEPEGEHAAAAVTAGMSMVGLRSTNFSSGQGIAYMHESLYAAVGKRLTYVLNVAARAMTKHALNVHAGHDDYHAVDDTGFFQLFSRDVQAAADLTLIAHRIAELSLNPGISAQDGFLTSHVIESALLPEPDLVAEYLGDPADVIESPTPAQRLVFGETRRRIPELFDLDYPAMLGVVQNQESYAQGVAAQRPFYFDHVRELTDRAMAEYAALTGRGYGRIAGYRMEDAEWVLLGQGSVVPNAEAVADHLRDTRGWKVGVVDLTMFRPFPADLLTGILRGRRGVTVLERVDQPLAVDAPLLREVRAAMGQGVENGRAARAAEALQRSGRARRPRYPLPVAGGESGGGSGRRGVDLPHPGVAALEPNEVPDFYSAGFGFGSRDLQPGDLVSAVGNMVEGSGRRQYYLGIDFIRKDTRLPKLRIWQEEVEEAYPGIGEGALPSAGDLDLVPADAISLRIHSVGGWGAITTGKNLALTAFELFGMRVKANPKYGSEKKGQPTTFYATFSRQPLRVNAELRHVDVVLSPDGNVFGHSDPLAGLCEGGVFVIQSEREPEEVWRSLPERARRQIRERDIRVFTLDGFGIASEEATDAELRYRMQGAAFMGAFFATSPVLEREGIDEEGLFVGIRNRLEVKFGSKGRRVVDDNERVIRRGFDEVRPVPTDESVAADDPAEAPASRIPSLMDVPEASPGIGDPGRFFEDVCSLCAVGQDVIADPFTAISAIPASTSAIRDMTSIRFEVPDFVAEACTGCSHCWMQCPDAAIPGLVVSVEDLLETAMKRASEGRPVDRVRQVSRHLVKEARKLLDGTPFRDFATILSGAYANVAEKLGWDPERREELDREWAAVYSLLADFPLARTTPFYTVPERTEKGSGGLLAITINPEACKGCNICVDVCPEDALVAVRQDEDIVDRLRRNWSFWEELPDTDDRFVKVTDLDEGAGVLSSLLLKKEYYRSMAGGDGACMGCGEKTAVHLVVSTIEAVMQPRVRAFVEKLDGLVEDLDREARTLLASGADLDRVLEDPEEPVTHLEAGERDRLRLLQRARREVEDLRWRYVEGPGGRGRAPLGITNSTGCSSVWGSTFPFNPYPFPWVNHLFQDAPSIAIGIFEGHMRKMADAFASVRRAGKLLDGSWSGREDEEALRSLGWKDFTDEEFRLCPPILAIGGDGAMLDIGFQNLSRLMASGKPIRVLVLDTQVYSNTGGQACTSGFTGQVADMSAWGAAQHGKEEVRKELGLIAMAHRGVFVHQSSQALASHLMAGVVRGLNSRRPAVFNIYTPCPVEHGLADDRAPTAARLALESRAFPFLTYDPDAGGSWADCLSLEGNPSPEELWPSYELEYLDEDGREEKKELPLTIADWAFTEARFRKHFRPVPATSGSGAAAGAEEGPSEEGSGDADDWIPFHEFVAAPPEETEGREPFIWTLDTDRHLRRVSVSREIVELARERLLFWHQLREIAGLELSPAVREAVEREVEAVAREREEALRAEYEGKLSDLRSILPLAVARRMAEGLLRMDGERTVRQLLEQADATPGLRPIGPDVLAGDPLAGGSAGNGGDPGRGSDAVAAEGPPAAAAAAIEAATAEESDDDELTLDPWIESALCTSCDDCIRINSRMFAYNDDKQAYVADPRAGTFAQMVQAAEKCPAGIIHPGSPLDAGEKDLEKWIERAKPFN